MLALLVPTRTSDKPAHEAVDPGVITLLFAIARSTPGKAIAGVFRRHAANLGSAQGMSSSSALPHPLP